LRRRQPRFFQTLVDDAHRLDATRPATLAGLGGCPLEWLALCDVVMINRYYGWYTHGGQLDAAEQALEQELDALHLALGKPIIISEFGADTLPGVHSDPPTLWSEEYQVEFLRCYLDAGGAHYTEVIDGFSQVCASGRIHRPRRRSCAPAGFNHKGVFTRDRQPKMAAHFSTRAVGVNLNRKASTMSVNHNIPKSS
jgi:beta-glucuronidase